MSGSEGINAAAERKGERPEPRVDGGGEMARVGIQTARADAREISRMRNPKGEAKVVGFFVGDRALVGQLECFLDHTKIGVENRGGGSSSNAATSVLRTLSVAVINSLAAPFFAAIRAMRERPSSVPRPGG
jgi:hypothetical protein